MSIQTNEWSNNWMNLIKIERKVNEWINKSIKKQT
jgi:hypothetical protein